MTVITTKINNSYGDYDPFFVKIYKDTNKITMATKTTQYLRL